MGQMDSFKIVTVKHASPEGALQPFLSASWPSANARDSEGAIGD